MIKWNLAFRQKENAGGQNTERGETYMAHRIVTKIQEIPAGPGQRLLVVSDIHGHLDRLIQLLRQMDYGGEDILVLVGDLIEKGPESLRVVQYVMDLARQHPVYVSMGNVDLGRLLKVDDDSPEGVEDWKGFLNWAQRVWGGSLFHEMLADMGISPDQVAGDNAARYRRRMLEEFHEELEFLWSRPTILTAGKYLFVHGGIPTEDLGSLEGTDPVPYLKNDNFLSQGHSFREHIVVTGHWPTCLYRADREDVSPVFDAERQILCIDGGNGLKRVGQLNGIILPDCQARISQISWMGYDGFPEVEALERQKGRGAAIHIQYFDSQVELLEQRGDMALWKQSSTGKEFEAPVEWTYRDGDGRLHCSDYADTLLDVEPEDRLSVIVHTDGGCYCKKNGLIGWYKGAVRPIGSKLTLKPGFGREPKPGYEQERQSEPESPWGGLSAVGRKECHRRERELAVYELLGRLGIEYERIDHVKTDTMEACQAVDEALDGAVICKNLFLCNRQRTRFYLLMMPGDKVFRTKELSAQIGSSRLSFGEAVYMEKYLHTSPGSVSVMGLLHDTEGRVQLLMDRDILRGAFLGCHPCMNTSSIRLRTEDLLKKFLPAVGHTPVYVDLTGEAGQI